MKFGPEWLRNMSADSTASNSMNIGGQIINSPGVSGSGGSGGGGGFMAPSNSNNNISNSSISSSNVNINANNLHNNINISSSTASRNTFPEFRYGREEMLLLFDRNCNIPEILPSFKNLFVERVQFPLALVPSTDEEMIMQATAPPTQRPAWLQRSPVGFSTTTRGTGRGGSMERGRMRGKSVYHPVFPRPNAMFEEDQRSTTIKTDRSWAERNGGAGGDSVVTGPTTVGGLGSDAWNGNTPSSSPRREFSNHPRNMENWRRSRNEDGSGDAASTTTFSADGGWRMNSSGFQNTHTRWGRSTSWRDEDLANNNENSGIGVSGAPFTAGGGIMMQRSYSTISTSHGERLGQQNIAKQTSGHPTGGSGTTRSISVTASGNRNSVCGNTWPNNITASAMSTNNTGDGANDDLALPEWAMENPSDIGGTFDASGAFHGAVDDDDDEDEDDDDNDHHDHHHHHHLSVDGSQDEDKGDSVSETKHLEKSFNTSEDHSKKSSNEIYKNNSVRETENCMMESSSLSPAPSSTLNQENNDNLAECDKSIQDNRSSGLKETATDIIQENVSENVTTHPEHGFNKDSSTVANVQNYSASDNVAGNNNAGDYAERMMKVADDMIEKLIMDDEDAKDDHMKSLMPPGSNKLNAQHAFVSALQQQQQQNSNHQTVSPALVSGAGPAGPPNMSIPALYNMAGMMVDHTHNMAALHQLQQQQMAAVAAVAIGLQPPPPPPPHPLTSSAPTDLWLYRDPQAKVQGPFSALEMTEWYRAGYFNENLFVRRVCDTRYRPLGELIKICNGQMPFNHSHLIPIDLNPSPMTPPLAPNMAAQPTQQTTNDFVMKTLSEQHQQQHQQHEELKGNVTAAADSLSNALKSLINSVDMSQVLNMHFQTLQERFIRNQEIDIVNELSKNECFQRMTAAEQDSVVRQKLQMMVLPEYLTNLTGLSNSLAALNPTAGTQLYDTIAECSKKEQLFSNQHQQQQQSQTHQQRPSHHNTSSTPYINADDFIMKTKTANHDLGSNDLLNEFNLRMFLNNGSETTAGVATPNSHANEFLNEQQLFGATAAPPNHPNNTTSQSPMMQMWMNQITANQGNQVQQPQQQQSIMSGQQQHVVNNQWLNGPLVGIPSIGMAREQQHGGAIMGSPKPIPTSMWDVATLEQHVQVQQQQLQQQKQQEQQLQQHLQQQNFEHNRHLTETPERPQQDPQQLDVNKQNNKHVESKLEQQQQGQQKSNELQKLQDATKVSINDINKQEQQQRQSQQASVEKSSQLNNNNKRNGNSTIKQGATKPKDDIVIPATNKKSEEERRREQVEEKRRQKEERKRQQMEEDKRRHLQAEEEKRRQVQEEEKRQQQIQAQRRKALMNTNNNTSSNNNNSSNGLLQPNSSTNSVNNVGNQAQKSNTKEQQRVQSSVAPWSTAAKSQGPGLAEIQKAERRERRADQQRQLEIQEKQTRALAAAAETQDTVLKWNAAPVPVKSFAEIQAEEAKRLAHEQMELQRRKEQETNSTIVNLSSGVATTPGGLNNTSNMPSIWSGTKIWGTSTNTTGFWEEPLKFNNNNITVTAAAIVAQSSTLMQPKPSALLQPQPTQQPSSNRNIKKSQSVTVMQNTISPMPSTSGMANSNQKKQTKLQKSDSGNTDNKKTVAKTNVTTTNKCDDYEAEFINWCTKSLTNMTAEVDVPTFVSFLRDLESPYEVKDYIRMYLGESKEYIDFAKQFLERRSKYKNLQRAQNAHNDDLCKPAQAITPSANDNSENKGKQKKVKKNKMTKLDARILGFSVTAAEGRINVGDRDYVDAP